MANVLASPRSWAKKAIILKAETVVGTDAAPTGVANWIEARNISLTPLDAERADRNIQLPYLGNSGSILVGTWCKAVFEVALVGPGAAGSAPKISPVLLGAGFAETITAGTSAVYNLISSGFGAFTAYINVDGVRHKMVGARANVAISIAAKGIPLLKVSCDSAYLAPDTLAMPVIDRSGWPVEEAVNATATLPVTINGVPLAFSSLDLDIGNQLTRFNLPGPQAGVEIVDRKPSGSVTVLAPSQATFDPFALSVAGTNVTLTTTHGSVAGKKAKVDAKVQISGVDYENIDNVVAYKLALTLAPVAGNDEFVLTYL
ncbi:hypothetical protein [Rhodocyclus tenuis]|uniref:Phage tail protein n=1 Tax=Rhodocyclus tenuis TaxID=1066 RepID=A0A840GCL4_RHOTE|nr:hypothetical protein [Rhodocyclus tenuis]MBB4248388.1 hypothetical protein [Rhodocyclus tenuis]